MRNISPDLIVDFIQESFPRQYEAIFGPEPSDKWKLPSCHSDSIELEEVARVRTLIQMLDALSPAPETGSDLVGLTLVVNHLRHVVDDQTKRPPSTRALSVPLEESYVSAPFWFLGGRVLENHWVKRLVDILNRCPARAPSQIPEVFQFIPDASYRAHLRQDLQEVMVAIEAGHWKSAVVMAGSLAEAMLFFVLEKLESERPAEVLAARQSASAQGGKLSNLTLEKFINTATYLGLIEKNTRESLHHMRDFRNLIHAGKAVREQTNPTRGKALMAYGAVIELSNELESRL